MGRGDQRAPERPLRAVPARGRALARALEGRRGGARTHRQHVEPIRRLRERRPGELRRREGRDRRVHDHRCAGAPALRRDRELPRAERAHADDRGDVRHGRSRRGRVRPARSGEHVAGRRRALRGRGADHHGTGLPRLGQRGERAAGLDGRRALRDCGPLGCRRPAAADARALPRRHVSAGHGRRDAGGRRALAARTGMNRRRIYLMRHAQVRYFEGVHPHEVLLPEAGRNQAAAARDALQEVHFDRVITSGLPRTVDTARAVAPDLEIEAMAELREIESGELRGLDPDVVQEMMTAAFRGVVPNETQFLGGESIGELFDRVLPEVDALLADDGWDVALLVLHGAVNRAILSRALTGDRVFLGAFEQAPGCINVLDVDASGSFVIRAVGYTPYDAVHERAPRSTTMEQLWQEYLDSRRRTP